VNDDQERYEPTPGCPPMATESDLRRFYDDRIPTVAWLQCAPMLGEKRDLASYTQPFRGKRDDLISEYGKIYDLL
jgi:hypothetical protein